MQLCQTTKASTHKNNPFCSSCSGFIIIIVAVSVSSSSFHHSISSFSFFPFTDWRQTKEGEIGGKRWKEDGRSRWGSRKGGREASTGSLLPPLRSRGRKGAGEKGGNKIPVGGRKEEEERKPRRPKKETRLWSDPAGEEGEEIRLFFPPWGERILSSPFLLFIPPSPLRVNPRIPLMTERGSLQPLSSPDFIRGIISAATLQVSLKDREGGIEKCVGEPRLKTRWEERCFPIPLPFLKNGSLKEARQSPFLQSLYPGIFPLSPYMQ